MGEHECKSGAWEKAGKNDALAGRPKSHYKFQKKACARFEKEVNRSEYLNGFEIGLKSFCTYKSGYKYGLEGNEYHDSCPSTSEESFFKGYTAGKKQRSLDQLNEEND